MCLNEMADTQTRIVEIILIHLFVEQAFQNQVIPLLRVVPYQFHSVSIPFCIPHEIHRKRPDAGIGDMGERQDCESADSSIFVMCERQQAAVGAWESSIAEN